jgi:hypothetical protein
MNPLARIAYNMIAEGGEAAARSSGDDMLKAAAKIADEGIDDWGWKGGKPGEITGHSFINTTDDVRYNAAEDSFIKSGSGNVDEDLYESLVEKDMSSLLDDVSKQLRKSKNPYYRNLGEAGDNADLLRAMEDFNTLERADIPREWTGKVSRAIRGRLDYETDYVPPITAKQVSDLMRPLTNDQRETFVSLLPEWSGSLDDLADAARSL